MGALEIIKKTMDKHRMVRDGDAVAVGFSGGPDSACLIHCLWRLLGSERLYAVHINHRIRGEAADLDMEAARTFCKERNIPFFVCVADVHRMAAEAGLSEEDAGRRVRYGIFERARAAIEETPLLGPAESLKKNGWAAGGDGRLIYTASADSLLKETPLPQSNTVRQSQGGKRRCLIAVAQNANDQAETVLMRIMRGTGTAGLGAMDYVRTDGIIRPLLDVTREQVEAYCTEQKLNPRIDKTNLEPDYTRNRIRLELIPYIKEHFNPNIIETLNRLASAAREDSSFICDETEAFLERTLGAHAELREIEAQNPFLKIPIEALRGQPAALRHRIYFHVFRRLGLERNIAAVHLEQADSIIEGGREGAVAEFPQGYRMSLLRGNAKFWRLKLTEARSESAESTESRASAHKKELKDNSYRVTNEAAANCEEAGAAAERAESGLLLETQVLSARECGGIAEIKKLHAREAFVRMFDAKAITECPAKLVLRTRRPGDFLRPLGMNGRSKKLQDFFVDKKVPKEERDQVLLVCLGQEVIWAAGTKTELTGVPGSTQTIGVPSPKQPAGMPGLQQPAVKQTARCRAYGAIGEPYKIREDTETVLAVKIISRKSPPNVRKWTD